MGRGSHLAAPKLGCAERPEGLNGTKGQDAPVTPNEYRGATRTGDTDMEPTHEQKLRIIETIREGKAVSEDEANWAVKAGHAAYGEDGDIDLTQAGCEAYDNNHV